LNALLALIGLAGGILSGLFGIGGGVIIVTALVALLRFPMQQATGTSLAALLLPVGILGVREYWKAGHVDVQAAAILAGGLLLGAWGGARWAQSLSPATLQRAFAVFLAVMAVRMWVRAA
jgi:uncharacterized membrane protein YfcA